ncbi:alpha/beta hydrolase [Flavobacteriaceae bacterium S356]|uniref:Alpha/beta hydrolase n=1 Tax=Asprobacillus argus TaxID=3076534 RepID=A0ABU3LED6_9FLAO|nr:alpha/beta hydrolase [Flavobacteriaceae bacterium S356]
MSKIHVYCMPGLGASPKIFEHIYLPEDQFEIHLLEWKIPISLEESIQDYANRMCLDITHENPVLVGVSFGGMIVQEMSKKIKVSRVIIISSVKTHDELPNRLKLAKVTKAYKLFPTWLVENFEEYSKYFLGDYLKKRRELYKMYLSVRNRRYMEWAIYNVLHWKQEEPIPNLTHIHGNEDHVFPVKHIENFVLVEKGTHVMILMKAKTISQIICNTLT